MFHPVMYDNIKVVLEGTVYDHDLDGEIVVLDRLDAVDLARFNRFFHIRFSLPSRNGEERMLEAEIRLTTELEDIASEQLATSLVGEIGCYLQVFFHLPTYNVSLDTAELFQCLQTVWGDRPHIKQKISYVLDEHHIEQEKDRRYQLETQLDFQRKISEENIMDLDSVVEHCIRTLRAWHRAT